MQGSLNLLTSTNAFLLNHPKKDVRALKINNNIKKLFISDKSGWNLERKKEKEGEENTKRQL